ncbi:uncharacterized protein LOC122311137 isoform X3 [Carya illinoinensis]|uniref:uncharacterized protein LOC122311137 isoform X3 n=1 Tax=Carya illinoinensis TaxID=32201 RepID=UPI001C71ABB7|nr:uncharacterized protein LOC122311137 isoform X3 [Carya illinoinensis]
MWVEIFCGLIVYRLFRGFFSDDNVLDVETSDSRALFSVANRFEKLYRGKVYVGLRIPDADTGSRQNIDMVLVTKGEAVVISVMNLSGFVSVNADGSWVCEGGSKHKSERLLDPVVETKRRASILESYLEQRGVALPEGYFSCKVVLPNQELRLELKGNKYALGEFLEFKGKWEDIQSLKNIKRSKVSRLVIQKTSMFGFGFCGQISAPSTLQVLYSPRDYRSEGASASEWKEVTVRSSTEVLFQPENSTKVGKFKISSVVSLCLTA